MATKKPRKSSLKTEDNPTVYNRLKRLELRCSICKPNRGENCKRHAKYGKTKPRHKDKRK
jgi:hypothetical protein